MMKWNKISASIRDINENRIKIILQLTQHMQLLLVNFRTINLLSKKEQQLVDQYDGAGEMSKASDLVSNQWEKT